MSQELIATSHAIRAVVFDLDGLMFNTESVFTLAGTELLRRRGKVPPPDLFHRMMGRRPVEGFQILIDVMDLSESFEVLAQESEEIFTVMLADRLAPMPGLYDLLALIEQRGLPKGVATSSPRRYMRNILDRFNLMDRFHITLTAEDVSRGKPHPEIYLTAAQRLGVDPREMLVLEDSEAGTRAAHAAGAHIISVPHEFSAAQDFSVARAIARSLIDPVILGLLEEHPTKSGNNISAR
ncbi:MAG: HAD family phosphatase [Planctomycetaceae bacterium]